MAIDQALLVNGIWHEDATAPIIINGQRVSFMKIYDIVGTRKVMELSTYPRAYRDTADHNYTVDTPFTVSEDDLNGWLEDGTRVYWDSQDPPVSHLLGSAAIHYIGEPLPGAFPLWIESETLSLPSWVDNTATIFPFLYAVLKGTGATSTFIEAQYRRASQSTWNAVSSQQLATLQGQLNTDQRFTLPKIQNNQHKYVAQIMYDLVFG